MRIPTLESLRWLFKTEEWSENLERNLEIQVEGTEKSTVLRKFSLLKMLVAVPWMNLARRKRKGSEENLRGFFLKWL